MGIHPVVVVTRDTAIPVLSSLLCVLITSSFHSHVAEVSGRSNGTASTTTAPLNCDNIFTLHSTYTDAEIHTLHADAFDTRLFEASEWDWVAQCNRYSLGWVVAGRATDSSASSTCCGTVSSTPHRGRDGRRCTSPPSRDRSRARCPHGARDAGCHFLHVGFEEALAPFYIDACGFTPTQGGLMELS